MTERVANRAPVQSQLSTQVSMDSVPVDIQYPAVSSGGHVQPASSMFLSSDVSMDAQPAGRSAVQPSRQLPAQQSNRRPAPLGNSMPISTSGRTALVTSLTERRSKTSQSAKVVPPRLADKDYVESEIYRQVSINSPDSGSFSISSTSSSSTSLDFEIDFAKYEHEMPPEIKIGYFDCLILYCEEDRKCVELFRDHLINEIILQKHGPVRAVLYDSAELISLAESKLKHLEMGVARCTYVFIYLTTQFVADKWMELSSESCLMNAIYDVEKRWCVVPVYTEKRSECRFKIPMGLNSLKGINYYTNDSYYRNGVARLIQDKIAIRVDKEKTHRLKQKKWIEEKKRSDADQETIYKMRALKEEMQTEEYKRMTELCLQIFKVNLHSGKTELSESQLSSIQDSLKGGDLSPQNDFIAEYYCQLVTQYTVPPYMPISPDTAPTRQQETRYTVPPYMPISPDTAPTRQQVTRYTVPPYMPISPDTNSTRQQERPTSDLGASASNGQFARDAARNSPQGSGVSADANPSSAYVQNMCSNPRSRSPGQGYQLTKPAADNVNSLLKSLPLDLQEQMSKLDISQQYQYLSQICPNALPSKLSENEDFHLNQSKNPASGLQQNPGRVGMLLQHPLFPKEEEQQQSLAQAGLVAHNPDHVSFNVENHSILHQNEDKGDDSDVIPFLNMLSVQSYDPQDRMDASSVGSRTDSSETSSRHYESSGYTSTTNQGSHMPSGVSYDGQKSNVYSHIQGNLPVVGALLSGSMSMSTVQEDCLSMPADNNVARKPDPCGDQTRPPIYNAASMPPDDPNMLGRPGKPDANESSLLGRPGKPDANESSLLGRPGKPDANESKDRDDTDKKKVKEPRQKIINYYINIQDAGAVLVGNENIVQGATQRTVNTDSDSADEKGDHSDDSPVHVAPSGGRRAQTVEMKTEIPNSTGDMKANVPHWDQGLHRATDNRLPAGEIDPAIEGHVAKTYQVDRGSPEPVDGTAQVSQALGQSVDQDAALSSSGSTASLNRSAMGEKTSGEASISMGGDIMHQMAISNLSSPPKPSLQVSAQVRPKISLPTKSDTPLKTVQPMAMIRPIATVSPQLVDTKLDDCKETEKKQVVDTGIYDPDETLVKSAITSSRSSNATSVEVESMPAQLLTKLASPSTKPPPPNSREPDDDNAVVEEAPSVQRFGATNYSDPRKMFFSHQTSPLVTTVSGGLETTEPPQDGGNRSRGDGEAVAFGDDPLSPTTETTETMSGHAMSSEGFDPHSLDDDTDIDFDGIDKEEALPSAGPPQQDPVRKKP